MDNSILKQYRFREQSGGTMIGGFSINNILESEINHLSPFSVPAGLYVSSSNSMKGGDSDNSAKIIIGGTIEESHFEKLYDAVAKHVFKSKKTSTKKMKK
uniref:Uncharacterized protein n=1 Tax=viral metagenome TaxID=1070528 RepID=A0A6C0B8E5_9ZZZZ